jgi:hypothetical protein
MLARLKNGLCVNDVVVCAVDNPESQASSNTFIWKHTIQCHGHDGKVHMGHEAEYDSFDVKATSRDPGEKSVPLSRTPRCNAGPTTSTLRLLPYQFTDAWRRDIVLGQYLTRRHQEDAAKRIGCRTEQWFLYEI